MISDKEITSNELDTSVKTLLFLIFKTVAVELFDHNVEHMTTIADAIIYLLYSDFQAHYPEICLAWLRSQDSNYNTNIIPVSNSSTTRVIHINCPVDVTVYNNNSIVAQIVNDTVGEIEDSSIICYINSNDEKIIYLPGDGDYTIDIVATDDGTVTYTVDEYNFVHYTSTRLLNYYDIPVTTGEHLTGFVPAISDEELSLNDINGSSVKYTLLDNEDNAIPASEEFTGEDIENEYYNVTLTLEGNAGYITGAGKYQKGNFAKLEAQILPTSEFYGWFINDELVSTDLTYRFAVTEDIEVVAKVKNVEFNNLTFKTTTGGKVANVDGVYSEGVQIQVVAQADTGYVFDHWESSNGGTFEDATLSETWFNMSNTEVEVTAYFKESTDAPSSTPDQKPDYSIDLSGFYSDMQAYMNQEFTVEATAGEGGSISNAGKKTVKYYEVLTYTITPDEGYRIKSVTVDGQMVGAVSEYTFKGVKRNSAIHVEFTKITD